MNFKPLNTVKSLLGALPLPFMGEAKQLEDLIRAVLRELRDAEEESKKAKLKKLEELLDAIYAKLGAAPKGIGSSLAMIHGMVEGGMIDTAISAAEGLLHAIQTATQAPEDLKLALGKPAVHRDEAFLSADTQDKLNLL